MSDEPKTTPISAGQKWVPTRPGGRAKPRIVVWAGGNPPCLRWDVGYPTVGWVHDPSTAAFPETGHDSWMGAAEFRAWVRKHRAVCQEPSNDQ